MATQYNEMTREDMKPLQKELGPPSMVTRRNERLKEAISYGDISGSGRRVAKGCQAETEERINNYWSDASYKARIVDEDETPDEGVLLLVVQQHFMT